MCLCDKDTDNDFTRGKAAQILEICVYMYQGNKTVPDVKLTRFSVAGRPILWDPATHTSTV